MEPHQIIKYLENNCSEAEKERILQWINFSPENRVQFESLKKIWEATLRAPEAIHPHYSKAWINITRKTRIQEFKGKNNPVAFYSSHFLKIAASVLVIVTMGLVLAQWIYNKPAMLTETNKTLSKKEVHLADGTVVYLNRNSSVVYPEKFYGKTRRIKMEGEVFFKVARDEKHPFIVSAKGTLIRVLGTSFNIKINGTGKIIVSVLSGKVAFQPANNPEKLVHLEKGEFGMYDLRSERLNKENITDVNFNAWETGILKFNNQAFGEVVAVLSEFYNKKMEVNPQLLQRKISVSFNNLSLIEVLDILEITLDIQVIQSSGIIQFNPLSPQP